MEYVTSIKYLNILKINNIDNNIYIKIYDNL